MFTFEICLPFLIIIAVFFVGAVVNLIKNDKVFRRYDSKHGRGKNDEVNY